LAIVSWQALPAIFPDAGKNIGGGETRLWTLAKAIAQHTPLRVAVATSAPRGGYPNRHENVDLWIDVDRYAATRRFVSDHIDVVPKRRLKRFHPALLYRVPWLVITRPLRRRDPEPMRPEPRLSGRNPAVWAAFGVTADSARTVATAMRRRRPSVVFIQSNADLDDRLARGEDFVSPWGDPSADRRFVIHNATTIVCQTPCQIQWLASRFGRTGVLLPNPIDLQTWRSPKRADEPYVLWIGRYDELHKRPMLMIRAAIECPRIRFRMVINPADRAVEAEVRRLKPPNVEIIDSVAFDKMPETFSGAKLLVSTGNPECEGFPNVLLQAAASHTAIVSLHDFGDFLARSGAGRHCAGSAETLANHIRSMWQTDDIRWDAVDAYLRAHHDLRSVAGKVRDLVGRLCDTALATDTAANGDDSVGRLP
jgi:glycosyltransferase involved in cell wall biosynthesis